MNFYTHRNITIINLEPTCSSMLKMDLPLVNGKVMWAQSLLIVLRLEAKVFNILTVSTKIGDLKGNDISLGSVCFDFHSTNVVQLSMLSKVA